MTTTEDVINVPTRYKQPLDHAKWNDACDKEMKALVDDKTLKIAKCPKDRRIIGYRWIFAIKSDGTYKAR